MKVIEVINALLKMPMEAECVMPGADFHEAVGVYPDYQNCVEVTGAETNVKGEVVLLD